MEGQLAPNPSRTELSAKPTRLFYNEEAGAKGLPPLFPPPPFPAGPPPPRLGPPLPDHLALRSRTLLAQSSRQRRFAPTAVHLHSGTPFGLPPESMFTFTGIPTHPSENTRVAP